jgi:hypothetical protein
VYAKSRYPEIKPAGQGGRSNQELRKRLDPYLISRIRFSHQYDLEALKEILVKRGLDLSYKTYTPEQEAEFKKHAHETLDDHGEWAVDQNTFKAADSDELRDEYRSHQYSGAKRIGFGLAIFIFIGLGGAYAGRQDFTNEFTPATFWTHCKAGLGTLIRKDGTALIRLIAGIAIILVGVGLAFVLASTKTLSRGTGRAVVGIVVLGAMVAASALSFVEVERVNYR